jgi:hypothetical protein
MSRYDRDDDNDDDDYDRPRRRPAGPKPHSVPGVIAFIGAIVSGVGMLVLIVIAGVISASRGGNVRDDDPSIIGFGLGILFCGLL